MDINQPMTRKQLFSKFGLPALSEDELEFAQNCIDAPVENVLLRIDQLNNETGALSFFVSETWRLAGLAADRIDMDEFATAVAPIMRRIRDNSQQIATIMSMIDIESERGMNYDGPNFG